MFKVHKDDSGGFSSGRLVDSHSGRIRKLIDKANSACSRLRTAEGKKTAEKDV